MFKTKLLILDLIIACVQINKRKPTREMGHAGKRTNIFVYCTEKKPA